MTAMIRVAVGWVKLEELNTEFIGTLADWAERQEIYLGVPVWHISHSDWIWLCLLWPKETGEMTVITE